MGNLSSIQLLDGSIQEVVDAAARTELETKATKANPTVTGSLSLGRKENTTVGSESVALGSNVEASGNQSYAEGTQTIANSRSQHVFGEFNIEDPASVVPSARGTYVEIVGNGIANNARGNARTLDWNGNEHLSGDLVINYGTANQTSVSSIASSAANALPSSAKGAVNGVASLDSSGKVPSSQLPSYVDDVVEYSTLSAFPLTGESGKIYVALDTNNTYRWSGSTYIELTTEIDLSSKADVNNPTFTGALSRGRRANTDIGTGSFAFGDDVRATGSYSYAIGTGTRATGSNSYAEGSYTVAGADSAHAEGSSTTAGNNGAHAEGNSTQAIGSSGAHAEGYRTVASGSSSHAEGVDTQANGTGSHSQGENTIANGSASHVFGKFNVADTYGSDWEEWISGKLYHVGDKVKQTFAWGANYYICKVENSDVEFDWDHWIFDSDHMNYVEIVGNGADDEHRSNARTLDWDGNERIAGDLYVHANQNGSGGSKVAKESDITDLVVVQDATPTNPNTRVWLSATPPSGIQVPTYAEFQALETTVGGKVSDVQVNGTTVVSNGTANIPAANVNTFGVVKVGGNGITVNSTSSIIQIDSANSTHVKAGVSGYAPITPLKQHESTFYGLAKAAGDNTMPSSSNAIGVYTAEAKSAIQTMLGVPGDVQVNGTSVVTNGVANIPLATSQQAGVVQIGSGLTIYNNVLYTNPAGSNFIKSGASQNLPIVPSSQHESVFYGLSKVAGVDLANETVTTGTYPASSKAAIQTMLGVESAVSLVETVSGMTPSITCQPNVQYICGEVSTISITPPANGSCDVIFESGSTAAVLTLPNTVKMPSWFDDSNLETDTIYEIVITNGVYGSVMTWES